MSAKLMGLDKAFLFRIPVRCLHLLDAPAVLPKATATVDVLLECTTVVFD
ncbi:hypothetical protein SJ05684_b52580 (plasmid) [Sinorhizobium sojae CCBAU 05684]|uniref:Uncharacterized protein n=1 Tax=Sinorhizobium sojae CCBAU 05684 TaxID=716928 RepID=A0A249PJW6_9HYPH|nr:hypothetical protein SJ05684_b52580 [Sinorhizobium sojae CCBAU 05684]